MVVIVMLKLRHHVKLYPSVFMDFWRAYFKNRIHHLCECRIEKSVARDHRLSSLGKPCDAKW